MSKIEAALNKARLSRGNNISTIDFSANSNNEGLNALTVSSHQNDIIPISRSNSKEISLMEEDTVLENNELSEMKVIYSEMPDRKIANSYRDLRTKLLQKTNGSNTIIMITSPTHNNTSSWTTLNLATAFSFDTSKTSLVIDCNLNNSSLSKLLNIDTNVGITDYLVNDEIDVSSILYKTGIQRLRFIPAGSCMESAIEYFTASRMKSLMSSLLSRYSDRYIFIDASPITESAGTRIIVELCDYIILVLPYGKVTKNKLKEAADAIGHEKLLGVVFIDKPNIPKFNI